MQIGYFIPQGWRFDLVGIDPSRHWEVMHALAARAEAGPWDSVWVYDHFHTSPVPSREATHEAWTLMAALAASTSRVRLGQMCTYMRYRNPGYLAKVAATADVISGGRSQMGLGGRWSERDWVADGCASARAGARLAMLEEGVHMKPQAWEDGHAPLHGERVQVDGGIVQPEPRQPVEPRLWVVGAGGKLTLRSAARSA